MGLTIEVGALARMIQDDPGGALIARDDFTKLNGFLADHALPAHLEPEILPALYSRCRCESYPYSFVHYLRRVEAEVLANSSWRFTPASPNWDLDEDARIEAEFLCKRSHLICHSDAEGYYLPIDFPRPLFDDGTQRVYSGMLGSSFGLRRELIILAPIIGVSLENGELSDVEAARLNDIVEAEAESPMMRELLVWLSLYEAARLSIDHKTAIAFL